MKIMRSIKLIMLFIVFYSCCQAQKRTIGNYIKAVGGEEKWKTLCGLVAESENEYLSSSSGDLIVPQSVNKNYTRTVSSAPDYFKLEIVSLSKPKYTLIYNGVHLKEIFEGGYTTQAPEYIIMEYKKRTFHFGEPWIVLNVESIKFLRNEVVDNIDCSVFRVTRLGFDRLFYVRNDDSLLYKVAMFDGKTVTYFSDYRNVDGYIIPFRSRGFVNGKLEIESVIKKIDINPKIPDSEFLFD